MKVLIPEWIPSYNKGEAAIFWGIVETFSITDEPVEIILFSTDPEYDKKSYAQHAQIITESLIPFRDYSLKGKRGKFKKILLYAYRCICHLMFLLFYSLLGKKVTKLFHASLWRAYIESDAMILGHDSVFSKYHNFLILFYKFMKKPVVIYGASFCPFEYKGKITRIYTRYCINQVDLITTRENYSSEFLKELGIKKTLINVTSDKAFLLRPANPNRGIEILLQEGVNLNKRPIIGFTAVRNSEVFRYGLRKIADPEERYKFHVDKLACFVEQIINKYKAQVVFIPHVVGPEPYSDDRIVAHDIFKLVQNKENVNVMDGDYKVDEIKSVLGHLDFMIGERTHSIIGAASMGVPFIAITHPKDYRAYGIIGDTLGQRKWLYNIEELSVESLLEFFDIAWKERLSTIDSLNRQLPEIENQILKNGKLFFDILEKKKILNKSKLSFKLKHER
jgi:polysaccharide pyruvyl transferase WcaK-like protein